MMGEKHGDSLRMRPVSPCRSIQAGPLNISLAFSGIQNCMSGMENKCLPF